MTFLLRLELPDEPGSLGRVSTVLGQAGADIEAIEIVEHAGGGTAVDDVFLELPPEVMLDSVVSACNELTGVRVLWVSRYAGSGSLFLDLEAVEALTRRGQAAVAELVQVLPDTFRCDWGLRMRRTDTGVEVVSRTSAAPEVGADMTDDVGWFPLSRATRLTAPESWDGWGSTVLAAAPLPAKDEIIVLGRRGGPEILDSELARLGHLTSLAASIAAS